MILLPIAAWIATAKSCRGISSLSFSAILRPHSYALSRWMITLKASIGSPLISMSSLHQVGLAVADHLVVERRVAARDRLELVVEVEDDLAERELAVELHPRGVEVVHAVVHRRAAPGPAS